VTVYGDFEFRAVVVVSKAARFCRWRRLGKRDFAPLRRWIGNRLRLRVSRFALILVKDAPFGLRRNGDVAA
jgi:hypothetical protein